METGILERMKLIMSYYNLSERSFAVKIGVNQQTINKLYLRSTDNVKLTTIVQILDSFPDIDEVWLVTGKGNMLRKDNEMPKDDNDEKMRMLEDRLKDTEQRVKELQYTIELQKGIVESQRIAMQIAPGVDSRSAIQQKIGQLEVIINDLERLMMLGRRVMRERVGESR